MRFTQAAIILLIVGFISHLLFYYPNLPETIASHFNASGEANGWMSKQFFAIFEGIILLIIILPFTLVPRQIEKMPDAKINLPNKEYWLATDRRPETFRIIRIFLEWFTIGLLALFIAVNQLVFRANLNKQNLSDVGIWTIVGIFLTFTIIWLIIFIRRFQKTN
jgi:uncharacterized membrane protein